MMGVRKSLSATGKDPDMGLVDVGLGSSSLECNEFANEIVLVVSILQP